GFFQPAHLAGVARQPKRNHRFGRKFFGDGQQYIEGSLQTAARDMTRRVGTADPASGTIGIDLDDGTGDVKASLPFPAAGVYLPADFQHIRVGTELRGDAFKILSRFRIVAEQQPATGGSQVVKIWRFDRFHYLRTCKHRACRETEENRKNCASFWKWFAIS